MPAEALAVAREIGYRPVRSLALAQLSRTAHYHRRYRQARWSGPSRRSGLTPLEYPGWIMRFTGHVVTEVLIDSGGLTAARRSSRTRWPGPGEAGDLSRQADCL